MIYVVVGVAFVLFGIGQLVFEERSMPTTGAGMKDARDGGRTHGVGVSG
jgi:hypothetical protein